MKFRTMLAGLLMSLALPPVPAMATTVVEQQFTCPIGGEKFKANVIASYSSFGNRPDGRKYGTLPIYPIVECPLNGLLLIEEQFSPADLAVLSTEIPSTEYQAMRSAETPHFRAWWLLRKLDRNTYAQAWALLQASWETDNNFERKVRYQTAFIAAATSLRRDAEHADAWLTYNVRAANALRELGHYDKAIYLLDRIDKPEFLPAKPEDAAGAKETIDALRALASEENSSFEPANLIPDRIAAWRCERATPPLTASELPVCSEPDLVRMRKEVRERIEREARKHSSTD